MKKDYYVFNVDNITDEIEKLHNEFICKEVNIMFKEVESQLLSNLEQLVLDGHKYIEFTYTGFNSSVREFLLEGIETDDIEIFLEEANADILFDVQFNLLYDFKLYEKIKPVLDKLQEKLNIKIDCSHLGCRW